MILEFSFVRGVLEKLITLIIKLVDMLKVSAVTIENLKNNKFVNDLPEFYELKNVIENNSWHNNDSVFNHTLAVLEKLEDLFKKANNRINSYLNQIVDRNTKKQLLFLGAIFHDIAKKETIVKNVNLTSCPKHEELGSVKVKNILDRIDLSETEKDIVVEIIKHHGSIHIILDPKNDKLEEQYRNFKSNNPNIFLELILLAMADTLGSQLKDNSPDEFNFRMNFYNKIIANY